MRSILGIVSNKAGYICVLHVPSLLIMLDGIRADGIVNAITPNMDTLIDGTFGGGAYQGGYAYFAQTIQDAPTSSAYNHVSIMTGVGATKHGVSGNNATAIAAVDYGLWPTYLSTLESAYPTVNTVFLATGSADLSMTTGADYDKQASDASKWSGATGTNVEIYRDSVLIEATANDGFYPDSTGEKGGGSYTSKVCETGAGICSSEVVTNF